MRRWKREAKQEEMIRLLFESGRAWSWTELAQMLDVDRRTLYRWRQTPEVQTEMQRRHRAWKALWNRQAAARRARRAKAAKRLERTSI
jgi:hypothetical protein